MYAIVPLNVLSKSKARLSSIMKPSERVQLSVAMLKDVLAALRRARRIHSTIVVSADKDAREIARRLGAEFLWEGKRRGLNKGVGMAITKAAQRGASTVIVIHSDLPLISWREVDSFIEGTTGYPVAIAPSKDSCGTNALLLSLPQLIQPLFGRDSFRRHLVSAKKNQVRVRVLRARGISFDIDEPKDLIAITRLPLRNETGRFLRKFRTRWVKSNGYLQLQ